MTAQATAMFECDVDIPADQSAALRYAPAVLADHLSTDELTVTSMGEGVRLVELPDYRGVRLWLLDESTRMRTGTYKSLDGCITTAMCRRRGIRRGVFSSGANTGVALSTYGLATGMEVFFFCPEKTFYKLDGELFDQPGAHLIAVQGPDRRVKRAAELFAQRLDVPVIPSIEWRLLSAGCRGCFIAEQVIRQRYHFTWFVQAVCAAYGPIGIYQTLHSLAQTGELDGQQIPRFLGVQQAGLSPIVDAWSRGLGTLDDQPPASWSERAIEPVLYNARPNQTYPMLCEWLRTYDGEMTTVHEADFERHAALVIDLLTEAGITLTMSEMNGRATILEKAGVLAAVGMLRAIDDGRIRAGETVLCSLTGGAGPRPSRAARAELCITEDAPLEQQIDAYVPAVADG